MKPIVIGTASPGNVGRDFDVIGQGVATRIVSVVRERFPAAEIADSRSPAPMPLWAQYPRSTCEAVATTEEMNAASQALRRAATLLKRRGLVIVASDLYDDEAAIGQLRRLARMGHDVIVVHTLSREELTLDVGGAAEFVDLENGRKLMVQPSAARDAYVAAVARWLTTIEQQLRRDGIDYLRLIADEPLEPALRRFLVTRRGAS